MRRVSGFLIGILIGAVVGSTVALLLAPDSGEGLREQLRATGESFLVDVRGAAESRRAELNDRLQSLRGSRSDAS
jgi:gas vesicle protein